MFLQYEQELNSHVHPSTLSTFTTKITLINNIRSKVLLQLTMLSNEYCYMYAIWLIIQILNIVEESKLLNEISENLKNYYVRI